MGAFQINRDALSTPMDNIAYGPKLGFLGSLEASYNEQVRYNSIFGAVVATRNAEQENFARIREAGGTPPPSLDPNEFSLLGIPSYDKRGYMETMRAMAAERDFRTSDAAALDDSGRAQHTIEDRTFKAVGERNNMLRELQQKYPDAGIKTYDDIFADVSAEALAAKRRVEMSKTTLWGKVGGFAGAAAGSVDPRTDPLNFATLPIGGFGKTILGRVAAQFGGQAAIETINQFTGVQENQRLLGGHPTGTDALVAIGMAGLGGAALQGVGEGVGALFRAGRRRWFKPDTVDPPPPAPEPAPGPASRPVETHMTGVDYVVAHIDSKTRIGKARAVEDMAYVSHELASWSTLPHEILPPTAGRLPSPDATARPELPAAWQRAADQTASIDEVARRVDPKVFAIYDKLNAQREELRAVVKVRDQVAYTARENARSTVDTAITTKERQLERARGVKKREKIQAEIDALHQTADKAGLPDNPNVRAEIQRLDEKMRDLAPTVSRAYARAQGKWDLMQEQHKQVSDMIDAGRSEVGEGFTVEGVRAAGEAKRAPTEGTGTGVTDKGATPTSAADTVADLLQRTANEDAAAKDKALESFRNAATRMLETEGDNATFRVDGIDREMHLDRDTVEFEDPIDGGTREMSIRDVLRETHEDNETLKAVSSCSIR